MKLSDGDREYLKKCGYLEKDMGQIEAAIKKTVYRINGRKRITAKKACGLLGRETYLSGLSRSAFHWSAAREIDDSGDIVLFDSSKLFE